MYIDEQLAQFNLVLIIKPAQTYCKSVLLGGFRVTIKQVYNIENCGKKKRACCNRLKILCNLS